MALPQWLSSGDDRNSEPPFSLTIRGSRFSHNLLQLFPEGETGSVVNPGAYYRLPFVRPESISLSSSGDDMGGSLSFVVEEPRVSPMPNVVEGSTGPWWREANLSDGALVEFTQTNKVDPLHPQTRLFTGFIDQISVGVNGGGQGSVAQISCVSTNAILDRIVVRKPVRRNRRGLSMGRFTIRGGSDAAQIADILRLANGKRRVGSRLVFDPTNYSRIEPTAFDLPLLEVRLGTLRSALESVIEAAQNTDGQRRMFYVDPLTGALVYGLAGESKMEEYGFIDANAPFRIVDDPAEERFSGPRGGTMTEVALSLSPVLYYRCNDDLFPVYNHTPAFAAHLSPAGSGTDPILNEAGPGTIAQDVEINNYAVKLESGVTKDLAGIHQVATSLGTRSLHVFMKGRGRVSVGGADGLAITTVDNGTQWVYAVEFDGTTYNSSLAVSTSSYLYLGADYDPDISGGRLRLVSSSGTTVTTRLIQNSIADAAALTNEIAVEANDGLASFAAIAFFVDNEAAAATTITDRHQILNAAGRAKTPNAITPRSLTVSVDHSNIVKTGIFLTADSAGDADSEPDPYVRNYAALRSADDPAVAAFERRYGPAFEAIIEAPTIRAEAAGSRTEPLNQLARAYFTVHRKPLEGGRFTIRGAATETGDPGEGTYGGQTTWGANYGFAGGWAIDAAGALFASHWQPGRYVGISNRALGLAGAYRIEAVTMTFEPGSWIRAYSIDFAHRPPDSIARLLALD